MSEETLSPEELAEFREFQKKKAAAAAEQKRRDDREAYAQLVDETIAECIPQLQQLSQTLSTGKRSVLDTFKKVLDMKAAVIPTKRDCQFSHTFTNSDSTMRITIGQNMLDAYPQRIINIHPALLPKYGGKGMYGHHVHEAVVAAGERESGITIHIVDENYDRGTILEQARCSVTPDETPDTLAAKIHLLEKEYFPKVIDRTIHAR